MSIYSPARDFCRVSDSVLAHLSYHQSRHVQSYIAAVNDSYAPGIISPAQLVTEHSPSLILLSMGYSYRGKGG